MTSRMGRGWMIGGALVALVVGGLVWAWNDGGERPLRTIESEAVLPKVGA